jgi:hypothetical protein
MDLCIGTTRRITPNAEKTPLVPPASVEGKVLSVRQARSRRGDYQGGEKRARGSAGADPPSGRVLLLLISEGYRIPKDIQSGNYRVMLRFVRQ